MDVGVDVPEITMRCWDILGTSPSGLMCATTRMAVERDGLTTRLSFRAHFFPTTRSMNWGARRARQNDMVNYPFALGSGWVARDHEDMMRPWFSPLLLLIEPGMLNTQIPHRH